MQHTFHPGPRARHSDLNWEQESGTIAPPRGTLESFPNWYSWDQFIPTDLRSWASYSSE